MSAFNTKQHSQPKGMRMDKAAEQRTGAGAGLAVASLGTSIKYRGLWISAAIRNQFDASIWQPAADDLVDGIPIHKVVSITRLLRLLCDRREALRMGISLTNYHDLQFDADRLGIDRRSHLQAVIAEAVRMDLTIDTYVERLGISYAHRLVRDGFQDLLSPNELSKLKPSDTQADLHRS